MQKPSRGFVESDEEIVFVLFKEFVGVDGTGIFNHHNHRHYDLFWDRFRYKHTCTRAYLVSLNDQGIPPCTVETNFRISGVDLGTHRGFEVNSQVPNWEAKLWTVQQVPFGLSIRMIWSLIWWWFRSYLHCGKCKELWHRLRHPKIRGLEKDFLFKLGESLVSMVAFGRVRVVVKHQIPSPVFHFLFCDDRIDVSIYGLRPSHVNWCVSIVSYIWKIIGWITCVIFLLVLQLQIGFALFLVRFVGEVVIVRHETLWNFESWIVMAVGLQEAPVKRPQVNLQWSKSLIFDLRKSLHWQGSPSWTCGRHGGTHSLDLHCWSVASGMSMRCWQLHQAKQVQWEWLTTTMCRSIVKHTMMIKPPKKAKNMKPRHCSSIGVWWTFLLENF